MKQIIFFLFLLCFWGCSQEQYSIWPDGNIPYVIGGDFTNQEKESIIESMNFYTILSNQKINFIFTDNIGENILHIFKVNNQTILSGLTTYAYKKNTARFMALKKIEKRVILHELGHVVGLIDEQQRPDRDLYVSINLEKLEKNNLAYFLTYQDYCIYDYQNYLYDYQSIMHYSESDCIDAIDSHGHEIGSDTLSLIDIQKINDLYNKKSPLQ